MKLTTLILLPFCGISQDFNLPDSTLLMTAVDQYYYDLATIQINELHQTRKFRWLAYVPAPGYSPFAGGFTLSVNLSGPLQEVRLNHSIRQKIEAIHRNNRKAATEWQNSVLVDLESIKLDITEYHSKMILDSIKLQSFNLTTALYNRNDITPSDFLVANQNYESWKIQRLAEELAIQKRINQLRIKAKMPAVRTNEHFILYP